MLERDEANSNAQLRPPPLSKRSNEAVRTAAIMATIHAIVPDRPSPYAAIARPPEAPAPASNLGASTTSQWAVGPDIPEPASRPVERHRWTPAELGKLREAQALFAQNGEPDCNFEHIRHWGVSEMPQLRSSAISNSLRALCDAETQAIAEHIGSVTARQVQTRLRTEVRKRRSSQGIATPSTRHDPSAASAGGNPSAQPSASSPAAVTEPTHLDRHAASSASSSASAALAASLPILSATVASRVRRMPDAHLSTTLAAAAARHNARRPVVAAESDEFVLQPGGQSIGAANHGMLSDGHILGSNEHTLF